MALMKDLMDGARADLSTPSIVESSRGKPAETSANAFIARKIQFATSLRWRSSLEGAESEIENPRTCAR